MDFEKLGAFYLGKEYDLGEGKLLDRLLMYDARDLTTHALCVGMTGSGKTGLCIDLLEEAAIDHVPAIIIDPKGDMTNLLLTFPELGARNFRPWINTDDARRKGLGADQFAAVQAASWKKGLAKWGQDGERIRMLEESTDFVIYTPGSDSGTPVSILQSFTAPSLSWDTESELLRERIQGTVSALLGLIGVAADPVKSREHILLANIFEYCWRRGEDLTLPSLILAIQDPPVRQLGVFDIDTFFPQKSRFDLAMGLNNIIAAPGFQSWLTGHPMDIASFLSTPQGKCRHSIFYIAHLSEPERMFFITMLLNHVVSWIRTQPGTTSLRALLYMDEIFGYFPPVENPPSKKPLLTLLKQARAYGFGVVLTTQNPVDLDYKGLSNAGTWFIGRLQTERDKIRVIDGLESASHTAGQPLNRDELSRIISGLGNRVFLLHNVHEEAPLTFQTRWAMSYLRGPLTRVQIRDLTGDRPPDEVISIPGVEGTGAPAPAVAVQPEPTAEALRPISATRPSLPPAIRQVFLPLRRTVTAALLDLEKKEGGPINTLRQDLFYRPTALGMGSVHFVNRKMDVDEQQEFTLLARPVGVAEVFQWERAHPVNLTASEFLDTPEPGVPFDQIPESINQAREFRALEKDLADHLYRTSQLALFYSPHLKLYSKPDETKRDFHLRLQQAAREKRDSEVDKLDHRYRKRVRKLQDRLQRAEGVLVKKTRDAQARKYEVVVSIGESLLGMFMGRRSTRAASTTMSKYRQSTSAGMSIKEAERTIRALEQEIQELESELHDQTTDISSKWDEALDDIDKVPVTPRRRDIDLDLFTLAWAPHWQITYMDPSGKKITAGLPAF